MQGMNVIMSKKPRKYEAMFLMGPQHTSDVEGSIKLVRGVIEKHGGRVLVAKKWDERKLAYEIGKAKRGLYIISFFEAQGSAIAPLERDVKLSEDFLRVLVLSADHLSLDEMEAVEPQPIAPPQPDRGGYDGTPSDRADRPSRGGRSRREETETAVGKE